MNFKSNYHFLAKKSISGPKNQIFTYTPTQALIRENRDSEIRVPQAFFHKYKQEKFGGFKFGHK